MKKVSNEYSTRRIVMVCLFLVLIVGPSFSQQKQNAKSGYASINGLKMYYEVHGKGEPMILLHGAYQSVDKMMRGIIAEYATTRQVIAFEFQGHGRTNDIERDITYENLADDANQLLEHLRLKNVDVFAFSMGSSVALQLAVRHPEKVRRMILLSGAYSDAGFQPSYKPIIPQISPAMFEGSSFKKEYDSLSPHPNKFPALVERLKKLDMTPFNWEKDYVKIDKPIFLVFGDNDVVTLAHITDMVTKLGGNVMGDFGPMPAVKLTILPNTSHVGMMTRFKWIYPMVAEFLK